MSAILNDKTSIIGHIYLITHTNNDKYYVGQTLSHRKNKGKYRPFGYEGRFKDHISEAICNTKKKQCTYLNNAIRKYGKEAFNVKLITTCPIEELDTMEEKCIKEYNCLYPNGYNLTVGGKVFKNITTDIEPSNPINNPKKRGGCKERTSDTRVKMSESLKMICNTAEAKLEQMKRSQEQHSRNKLLKFKDVVIDSSNLDQYIHIINSKNGKCIRININGVKTLFVGKYETIDTLKEKALDFLNSLVNSATLPN